VDEIVQFSFDRRDARIWKGRESPLRDLGVPGGGSVSHSASAPNVQPLRRPVMPARSGSAASGAATSAPTPSYLRD